VTLPWGILRERVPFPEHLHVTTSVKPGEFILQTLFAEFTVLAQKKIEGVLDHAVSHSLASLIFINSFTHRIEGNLFQNCHNVGKIRHLSRFVTAISQ
jgi:hypothetical protein